MKVKVSELNNQIVQVLLKHGYKESEAVMIRDVLMFGQMSGKLSHGIIRLFKGALNVIENRGEEEYQIEQLTSKSATIKAHKQPGMLIGHLGMNKALEIARNEKIGIVTTNGTVSTSGCLAYYLEKIAQEGYLGIIMSNSEAFVAPFNSIEPLFGTNPMGFAFPSNDKPLIFDMATSITTFGHVVSAATTGKQLPENIALNKDGNFTIDPNEAIEGSILPFDNSYKGSGLGMVVEILAGVLSGSSFIDLHKDGHWGNLFIVLSPDLLIPNEEFKNRMSEFIERLENARTKDGQKVRIPGMRTLAQRDENVKDDEIEIEDEILNEFYTYL